MEEVVKVVDAPVVGGAPAGDGSGDRQVLEDENRFQRVGVARGFELLFEPAEGVTVRTVETRTVGEGKRDELHAVDLVTRVGIDAHNSGPARRVAAVKFVIPHA